MTEPIFIDWYSDMHRALDIVEWASDHGFDVRYVDDLVFVDPDDPASDLEIERGYWLTAPTASYAMLFKLTWGGK